MKRDLVAGVFRNRHAVMHSVGRARRDEPHIHHSPRRPSVTLVDGVAVRVDLQRAVEVCTFFDRTLAVALNHAAPEDGLAFVVGAFQFEPGVVGVDSAAGEKVSNFLRAHDYVHAHGVAAAQRRLHVVQRSGDRRDFSASAGSNFGFGFFAYGERCGQVRLSGRARLQCGLQRRLRRRQSKNIHRKSAALQECFGEFQLGNISVRRGNRGVRSGEAMRVYETIDVARILRCLHGHVAIGALLRLRRIVE